MDAVRSNLRPRDICTRKAFENAIAGVAATGGSTNAVLHLLAMAREAEVPLSIDDFDAICARTPIFVDLKPAGRFMAADVDKAGGIARDRQAAGGRQATWMAPRSPSPAAPSPKKRPTRTRRRARK